MTSGPVPTRLVFLNDLQTLPSGSKVRFLGCVTHYSTATGTLTLQHAYPPPPHSCPTASVDVKILLETLKATDTQIGEWVNVMGYVEDHDKGSKPGKERVGKRMDVRLAKVQAIMLWSAGTVNLGEYEQAVLERKKVESEIRLSY